MFFAGAAALAAGCTAQPKEAPSAQPDGSALDAGAFDGGDLIAAGERLYREPLSTASKFACANCHALEEPADDGLRRPAHPLGDAAKRPNFMNGKYASLLEAINVCLVDWLASPPWTETDLSFIALREFLSSRAPAGNAEVVHYTIVEAPADTSGGDPARGRALFDQSCAVCHGNDGAGTAIAPPLFGAHLDGPYIARRARSSGPARSATFEHLTGGLMPFWGGDRLSDAELRDLIAFITAPALPDFPDAGAVD